VWAAALSLSAFRSAIRRRRSSALSITRWTASTCQHAHHRADNVRTAAAVDPLECKGNYSATSNNMKLLHWPLIGGLLHFGTPRMGLDRALLAIPNVTPPNHQRPVYQSPYCGIMVRCGLNVPFKGLIRICGLHVAESSTRRLTTYPHVLSFLT